MPLFVTHAQFVRNFPALVLDQRIPPKKREWVVTLLVGAMVGIEVGKVYDETAINVRLQAWVDAFGDAIGWDRVALRRMLVDEGYLQRDASGTAYQLRARTPRFGYAESIRSLDLRALVADEEEQRAARKRAYVSEGDR